MDRIEFAERYVGNASISDFKQRLEHESPFDHTTLSLTLGMLGVKNYSLGLEEEQRTAVLRKEVQVPIWNTKPINDYFRGTYIPRSEDGIGNPTADLLQNAFSTCWYEIDAHLKSEGHVVTPVSRRSNSETSHRLRTIAATLLYRRHKLIHANYGNSKEKYSGDTSSTAKGNLEGAINEFDAAITLLDLIHDHPIIVVPAPSLFERGNGINSDFLIYDVEKETACGVQIKARSSIEDREKHKDPENGVVLISGMEHLDNYTTGHNSSCNSRSELSKFYQYAGTVSEDCIRFFRGGGFWMDYLRKEDRAFGMFIHRLTNPRKKQSQNVLRNNHQLRLEKVWHSIEPVLYSKHLTKR